MTMKLSRSRPQLRAQRAPRGTWRVIALSVATLGCGTSAAGLQESSESGEASGTGGGATFVFDEASGPVSYFGGLDAANWIEDGEFITPNAGTQCLASGNGNSAGAFEGLGFTQTLDLTIDDQSYDVSFYVAVDLDDSMPIEFSDFSELWIGRPEGVTEWTATPPPAPVDTWVQWRGVYTPEPSAVGQPFEFHALFDLPGLHSIAIDGPIEIVPR